MAISQPHTNQIAKDEVIKPVKSNGEPSSFSEVHGLSRVGQKKESLRDLMLLCASDQHCEDGHSCIEPGSPSV